MSAISGVLILNKPAGMTSHDCVNRIRRLYGTKQVGHTGTLDPGATGVLPILIGRAVKASDLLTAENKTYRAGLRLGITTDTEDTSGEILSQTLEIPSKAEVEAVISDFIGDIMQTPPMYSALKVNGRKLVDLARSGITIDREPRPIKIYSLKAEATQDPAEYVLTVCCSKGTYIRTLCADIGARLGCGGAMNSLVRLASGGFELSDSVTIGELEAMSQIEREALLKPVETLFMDLASVMPEPFFEKLSRDGNEIYQKKIGTDFPIGTRVRLYSAQQNGRPKEFYALGEVREYPQGSAIKVIKLFSL
jgi:tRNA pseudouridine55 synthase